MQSLLAYWSLRFCVGIVGLIVSGLGAPSTAIASMARGNWVAVDVAFGFATFWIAMSSVTPLVRLLGTDARLRKQWGDTAHRAFAGMSTAQRVFLLLLAVAEADGKTGPAERELVRTFLQRRFVDGPRRTDIDGWEATLRPPRELTELARLVARELERGEAGTIYSWACMIAFADGPLQSAEFRALQQLAIGLGLAPHHAMFLFEFAQQAARNARYQSKETSQQQDRSDGARTDGRKQQQPSSPPPRGTPRERALATLGLDADATAEAIRRRHRELARKFHPDAHRNLGPVALREATDRFIAIQQAYEELSSSARPQ